MAIDGFEAWPSRTKPEAGVRRTALWLLTLLGPFVGLIAGMSAVAAVNFGAPQISFLWHNVIGAVTVVAVGIVVGSLWRATPQRQPDAEMT